MFARIPVYFHRVNRDDSGRIRWYHTRMATSRRQGRVWTITALATRFQCHRTALWKKATKLGLGTKIGHMYVFSDAEADVLVPKLDSEERAYRSARIRDGLAAKNVDDGILDPVDE